MRGTTRHQKYRVLEVESSSVPNAIAAVLLHIRDASKNGNRPDVANDLRYGTPEYYFKTAAEMKSTFGPACRKGIASRKNTP